MDALKPPSTQLSESAPAAKNGRGERRRRSEVTGADVRFFLPKTGTSAEKPELGREMESEADALVEAFKTDKPFYTLVVWRAVPEKEDGIPRIVKEAVKRST